MKARDLVEETFTALDANRIRSLLTVLGVVIGISAVIMMSAIIGGMKNAMLESFGLEEARLVNIYCGYGDGMRYSDLEAMQSGLSDYYEFIYPRGYYGGEMTSDTKKVNAQINAQDPKGFKVSSSKLINGRFYTAEEEQSGAFVLVVDQGIVKALFGDKDANVVGKTVNFEGSTYTICGIMQSNVPANSENGTAWMPYHTYQQRISSSETFYFMEGLAKEDADLTKISDITKQWLVRYYNIPQDSQSASEDISVQTMDSIMKELNGFMTGFQMLMMAVSSISLLVGGIGIMNNMLTNVTERIREIGLRKALGAKNRDITNQFLLESVCLTMAGGIIGIILGYLGSIVAATVAGAALSATMGAGTELKPDLSLSSMLLVAGICVFIGVVFGYYPAKQAARLDPVESLRYQ